MFDSLLLTGIFISLLAGQFARIEFISALANVYVHEFLLLIYITVSFIKYGIEPIRKFLSSKVALAFLGVILASFAISYSEFTAIQNGLAFLYLMRGFLYFLFSIYLHVRIKEKKNITPLLYNLFYSFSVLLLITTAIQYIFYPNFWVLKPFGWDPHMYRASSAYFDIYVAAALYGILAFFWLSKKNYILFLLFVGAIALSFSRSAYVAFAVSLTYFFITQKRWKEIALSLGLFVILIIMVPKPFGEGVNLFRTASINSRIQDYKLGLQIWSKKPILGFGYNRIRFAKEKLYLIEKDDRSHSLASFHSSLLMILVTTGVVGFSVFAALVLLFFRKFPHLHVYGTYIIVMSLFDNVLLHVLVVLPLMLLVAYLEKSKKRISHPLSK